MQNNNKPNIAKKLGLLTTEEAAEYIGMSEGHFRQTISPHLGGVNLGKKKYFTEKELIYWVQARIANVAQIAAV